MITQTLFWLLFLFSAVTTLTPDSDKSAFVSKSKPVAGLVLLALLGLKAFGNPFQ